MKRDDSSPMLRASAAPRHSPSAPAWNVGVVAVLAGLVTLGGIALLASAMFTAALILPVPPLQGRGVTAPLSESRVLSESPAPSEPQASIPASALTEGGQPGTSE
jgi:hypothetical protein